MGKNAKAFGDSAIRQRQHTNGVLMASDSGNDPRYYAKKQEAERRLGRKLTTEEFQRDQYAGPDSYDSVTSIFDPVLCELAYRWFCPPGGHVLDPFAGGSVRGIVAGILGRKYTGLELRAEQVEANRAQAGIVPDGSPAPAWIITDSALMDEVLPADFQADMVFSCPPYADLEVYSDDPADLSNMPYADFLRIYRGIISKAVARMKPDTFACFVVGEVRAKNGEYYGFVPDTIAAFVDAGASLYNEAILVTAVGSLPICAAKQFEASRKLGKTHQNVLVFVKGDGKKATKKIGAVEFGEISDQAADE